MNTYLVNEVFASVQGEGIRAGTFNVFCRFSACNLTCGTGDDAMALGGAPCDTEFVSGVKMTAEEILGAALHAAGVNDGIPQDRRRQYGVIFTGGEPALQLDYELVQMFRDAGFYAAIETNGTKDVSMLGLDWITCSPKIAEHAVRCLSADEIKYVRGAGQGIPKPRCQATHKLLSPAFDGMEMDREAVATCIKLVKENPEWRLSLQQHKFLRVR